MYPCELFLRSMNYVGSHTNEKGELVYYIKLKLLYINSYI